MSSLYAMQFSTGLVKVGRAKDATARMGNHRSRLAVAGIHVAQQHTAQCVGDSRVAEAALILKCVAGGATADAGLEWFTGLSFADVKTWVDEEAARVVEAAPMNDPDFWLRMQQSNIPSVAEIRAALKALTYAQIHELSSLSGVPFTTIWKVRDEKTDNPRINSVRAFWPHVLTMRAEPAKAAA